MSFTFRTQTLEALDNAMQGVIDDLAQHSVVHADSDPTIPYKTGFLKSTGYAEPGSDLQAAAGYRAPYAYWPHRKNPWFQRGIDSACADLDSIVRDHHLHM